MNNICEKCHFYTGSDCRFKKEFNTKYEECDYFISSDFVFEQVSNSVMEIKKIKNMMEKPDFQKKMDVFIERSQDLKEPKSLEEHTKQLEENFNELFDGVNIFSLTKEGVIEILKEFALPLIAMYADYNGKIYYADYEAYVEFCKKIGLQPIVTKEKFELIRKLYEND